MPKYRSWQEWEVDYMDNVVDPPTVIEEEKEILVPFAYLCEEWDEAEEIDRNYRRATRKRDRNAYVCDLEAHVGYHNGVVWRPLGSASCLIGVAHEHTFVVSHFSPASTRGGVELLKKAAQSYTPFVFAVPDHLAQQLIRLGFVDTGVDVPQYFNGSIIQKNVVVNKATSREDLDMLANYYCD